MTVVALWVEPSDGNLWVAADTRLLMSEDNSRAVIRTNAASKILGLPVKCSLPAGGADLRAPFYQATLGFVFAGDVVPAQATFAMASTLAQSLVSIDSNGNGVGRPVDISAIAILCAQLATRYTNETREATNGRRGEFEAAVFGWSPTYQAFQAFRFFAEGTPAAHYVVEEVSLAMDEPPLVLGEKELYAKELNDLTKNGDQFQRTSRLPLIALENMIDKAAAMSVGGGASVAIVPRGGSLIPFGRFRPQVVGQSDVVLSFNGLPLPPDGPIAVGHCYVWMPSVG